MIAPAAASAQAAQRVGGREERGGACGVALVERALSPSRAPESAGERAVAGATPSVSRLLGEAREREETVVREPRERRAQRGEQRDVVARARDRLQETDRVDDVRRLEEAA